MRKTQSEWSQPLNEDKLLTASQRIRPQVSLAISHEVCSLSVGRISFGLIEGVSEACLHQVQTLTPF